MTQYVINIGAIPNDGTGDPLRTAFNETNLNFNQVFAAGPVLSNIQIANNAILTTNTNGNLVFAPNGTGVVQSNVSIVPNLTNLRNLGSATNRWNTVYTRYIDYVSGNITTDNITITGVLTAPEIVTNLIHSDDSTFVNIQDGLNVSGDVIAETVSATNIVVNNISSDDSTFVTIQDGLNVSGDITTETVSAVGNVAGNYFIGNGSQLTGIVSSYGDANVATFMADYGSNTISTVGNITSNYYFGNTEGLIGNITNLNSLNFTVENISALIGNNGVNIGAGGNNNLVVLPTEVIIQNVPLTVAGNILSTVAGGLNITANTVANGVAQIWNFSTDGNLTIPTNGNITTSSGSNGNINFHPDGSGTINIAGASPILLRLIGDEPNTLNRMEIDTYGNQNNLGGTFTGVFYRGTPDTPEVVQSGDRLASLKGKGYNGSTFTNPSGQITIDAQGSWSNATNGTHISFWTTPANSNVIQESARIYAIGDYHQIIGNIVVDNGNVTADYFFGDGSQLTNLPGASTGNVTFDNQIVIGTGDSGGGGGLYLAPGNTELANVQYFRVRGGDFPTHLHFDTGNNAYYDQYFGADNKFVKLEANGNIVINADDSGSSSATWTFDVNGTITLPPTSTAAIEGTVDNDVRIRAVSSGDSVSAKLENYNGNTTTTSVSANPDTVTVNADNSNWVFDTTGNLTTPQGGWIGAAGVKGDGTMLTGGTGNITSVTSYYADAPGIYSSCLTANPGGTLDITTYGNGTGMLGQWTFNGGGLSLATVNNESAQFVGTRKIVNGALTGATAPYSVTLNTGGTPTVAYTSSAGVYSTKVTFVTQSTGAGFNWEQFDVVAVPSQDIPGEVNFVVSNRVKALSTVPDTVVTATINGSQIEISLTLDVVQGGGYASFDATEFGLMVD